MFKGNFNYSPTEQVALSQLTHSQRIDYIAQHHPNGLRSVRGYFQPTRANVRAKFIEVWRIVNTV